MDRFHGHAGSICLRCPGCGGAEKDEKDEEEYAALVRSLRSIIFLILRTGWSRQYLND